MAILRQPRTYLCLTPKIHRGYHRRSPALVVWLEVWRAGQNPKATAPAAKMPNPSIAIAVASYAGSMNIREFLCVVRHAVVAAALPKLRRYSAQRYARASGQPRG